jgi:Fe-S cluster assembly protein SufD
MSSLTTNYLAPSGREEAWRFTPLNRLSGILDAATDLIPENSFLAGALPAGVILERATIAPLAPTSDEATLRVRSAQPEALLLTIAANAEIAEPILLSRIPAFSQRSASRLIVKVGTHARVRLILENQGSAVLAEDIEYDISDGATLNVVSLQEWESDSVYLASHHALISKDATFISTIVSVGGSLVRILPTVEYRGPGASAELNGLYFATDGQHLEHRIHVDHNVGHAKSRVNYKGALAGDKARTVWIGDVYIRAEAEGTDTYELNRNLLLTDGARADSVPNLEIETGEIVGAGHASTTGRFDDEQLFYLESRGIPAEEARRLVIRGFFAEIASKIGVDAIQERIMERIDRDLAKVGA